MELQNDYPQLIPGKCCCWHDVLYWCILLFIALTVTGKMDVKRIDAYVAVCYKKKRKKVKKRCSSLLYLWFLFAVSTNWISLNILPKNSFKSDCCLPSMKLVKDLALVNMATWVIKLYKWGRQALFDWQCTGDIYILFWDWIFCSLMYLFGDSFYCCQIYMFSVS